MFSLRRKSRTAVPLLVDHLEDILSLTQRLRGVELRLAQPEEAISGEALIHEVAAVADFVERLSGLELALAARVEQARSWAEVVGKQDSTVRPITQLYLSGTQALVDMMPRLLDPAEESFHHGNLALPFLRRRQVIEPLADCLETMGPLQVGDGYRVFGIVPLGDLEESSHALLTTLDARYQIYAEDAFPELVRSAAATPVEVAAVPIVTTVPGAAAATEEPAAAAASQPAEAVVAPVAPGEVEASIAAKFFAESIPVEPDVVTLPEPQIEASATAAPVAVSVETVAASAPEPSAAAGEPDPVGATATETASAETPSAGATTAA